MIRFEVYRTTSEIPEHEDIFPNGIVRPGIDECMDVERPLTTQELMRYPRSRVLGVDLYQVTTKLIMTMEGSHCELKLELADHRWKEGSHMYNTPFSMRAPYADLAQAPSRPMLLGHSSTRNGESTSCMMEIIHQSIGTINSCLLWRLFPGDSERSRFQTKDSEVRAGGQVPQKPVLQLAGEARHGTIDDSKVMLTR